MKGESAEKMKRSRPWVYFIVLALLLGLAAFVSREGRWRRADWEGFAMDTVVRLQAAAPMKREALTSILADCAALLDELDRKLTAHGGGRDAQIVRINRAAGSGAPIPVSDDVWALLNRSTELSRRTEGAFDPTVGALSALWRINDRDTPRTTPPEAAEIERARSAVGAEYLVLVSPDLAGLTHRGTLIDLGGIAKGYASGVTADLLRSRGVLSALVDLGGNVVTIGERPDGGAWRIGVQHPFRPRGTALCALSVRDASVITAGVYERNVEIEGVRYTHILDPRNGRPVSGDLLSVTIVSDDPTAGDALSTAFVVLGLEDALRLIGRLPGVEALFVHGCEDALRVTATQGLKGALDTMGNDVRVTFAP